MTQLHTGAYVLRPFTAEDAPAFAAAVSESAATLPVWMPWAHAGYTEAEALSWFAFCDDNRANGRAEEFGIFQADGRTLVGGAGVNHFNTLHAICNLGYWVRESAQRQGAALAATKALAQFAFEELKFTRVEIVVADGNTGSYALALKAGATHECLARNRLQVRGEAVAAHVFSLVPDR